MGIKIKWNKKENDLEVFWDKGLSHSAGFFIDLFSKEIKKEIAERGFNIKSMKFSIESSIKPGGTN